MATESVRLQLESSADLSGFGKAQKAVKDFGKDNREQFDSAKRLATELSTKVGGELGGAFGTAQRGVEAFLSGGIWGMAASVAGVAITALVSHFRELEERAARAAEIIQGELSAGLARMNSAVKGLAADMADANKDLDEFIKTSNGKISADAKYEVARLHNETLQKITDGMSESGKSLILAQEAYDAALINARAAVDAAEAAQTAIAERRNVAEEQVVAALANLAEANARQREYTETYSKALGEHRDLQYAASKTVQDWMSEGLGEIEATRKLTDAKVKLAEFEKSHRQIIDGEASASRMLADAKAALADAQRQQRDLESRSLMSTQAVETAHLELAAKEREMGLKVGEATEKQRAEIAAAELKASKDKELAQQEEDRKLLIQEANEWLMDESEIVAAYNEALKNGIDRMGALDEARKRLTEALEDSISSETSSAKSDKKTKAKASAVTSVSIDAASLSKMGESIEAKQNFKDWMQKIRDEQKAGRDSKNNMKIDQPNMVKYLKRDMAEKERQEFEKYLKSKYTENQIKELGKLAMNTELLSKKDAQQQKADIKRIADTIKKALEVK